MKQARTASSAAHHTPATAVATAVKYTSRRTGDDGIGRILCRIVILLLCLSSAGVALAADRPIIREVLISKEGNGARIEIRANQPLVYRSYLMPALGKWVIDLPGAITAFGGDESKKLRTAPLERITLRQKEVNGELFTRISLNFEGEVNFSLGHDPLDQGHLVVIMTPLKATSKIVSTDQLFRP